jgi:ferredoxin
VNLLSAAERLAAIDHSGVVLHTESCLHSVDKYSTCQACDSVCPTEAIQPGKPPHLEAEKCQGCLACLPVCPTGAFQADDAIPNLLNCAARLEIESLELLCEHNPLSDKGLKEAGAAIRTKGCLAGIGSGGYLALLALGLAEVIVREDACSGCPWGELKTQIEAQIASTQILLSAWGREKALRLSGPLEKSILVNRPVWEASNPPLSRRDLFRLATRQGQLAAARVLSADRPPTGKHASRQRLRMLAAIAHFPEPPESGRSLSLEGLDFAVLTISAECTACGVCSRVCPTGALQFSSQEDLHYQLAFDPGNCIGCKACMAVCGPQAIDMQAAPSFGQVFGNQEPVSLIAGDLAHCERCQTMYAARPGSRLCPPCEFRQKNPFGSLLPPGSKGTHTIKTELEL